MDTSREQRVATEILAQILTGAGLNTYGSWGVSKRYATSIEGNPALLMKVSGLIHKGWVAVMLNGKDLYNIRLMDARLNKTKEVKDVWADMLGDFLDEFIEHGCMSKAEYKKAVRKAALEGIIKG